MSVRESCADDRHRSMVPVPAQGDHRLSSGNLGRSIAEAIDADAAARLASAWASQRRAAGATSWQARAARRAAQRRFAQLRKKLGVTPVYKLVDTCAAEFESYHALSLLDLRRRRRGAADGQARRSSSWAAGRTASGRESSSITAAATRRSRCGKTATRPSWSTAIPETVSTDYDTSDRLYFEPLTLEDVLAVYEHEASVGARDRHDRAVRRADSAEPRAAAEEPPACPSSAPRRSPSTSRKTASASASCSKNWTFRSRRAAMATSVEEAVAGGEPHRLSGAGAALLRARRTRHGDRLRRRRRRPST